MKRNRAVTDDARAQMAATIFAGMCSDEWLMRWAREEQNKAGNGQWNDHLALVAAQSVDKILEELGLGPEE